MEGAMIIGRDPLYGGGVPPKVLPSPVQSQPWIPPAGGQQSGGGVSGLDDFLRKFLSALLVKYSMTPAQKVAQEVEADLALRRGTYENRKKFPWLYDEERPQIGSSISRGR